MRSIRTVHRAIVSALSVIGTAAFVAPSGFAKRLRIPIAVSLAVTLLASVAFVSPAVAQSELWPPNYPEEWSGEITVSGAWSQTVTDDEHGSWSKEAHSWTARASSESGKWVVEYEFTRDITGGYLGCTLYHSFADRASGTADVDTRFGGEIGPFPDFGVAGEYNLADIVDLRFEIVYEGYYDVDGDCPAEPGFSESAPVGWTLTASMTFPSHVYPQAAPDGWTHVRGDYALPNQLSGCGEVHGDDTISCEWEFDISWDLEPHPVDRTCVSQSYHSVDIFYAFIKTAPRPQLSFQLDTQWCLDAAGAVVIQYVTPTTNVRTPLTEAIESGIRLWLTYHEFWEPATYTPESLDGNVVTASADFKQCFGIPILGGKAKWVKETGKLLRLVASLLRKADGKLQKVARPIAKLMDKAAGLVDFAIKHGGRLANKLANGAIRLVAKAIQALPKSLQMKAALLVLDGLAKYHSTAKWARDYLEGLPGKGGALVLEKQDMLPRLLSDEAVCFSSWKPQIRQTLGDPEAKGVFVDRQGDRGDWIVQDHQLPPLSAGAGPASFRNDGPSAQSSAPPQTQAAPTPEATPEPIAEATPEPIAEATPEPIAEATPEPIAEATPEPIAEATPGNQPPVADAGGPYEVDEGGTVELDGSSSLDADGEIAAYEWSREKRLDDPTRKRPTFDAVDDGKVEIDLTVTDDHGATDTATAVIRVRNVDPRVGELGPFEITAGDELRLEVAIRDAGRQDTHQVVVEWGDGTSSDASMGQDGAVADASHTYADAGEYEITVTVTDDDGGRDSRRTTVLVTRPADRESAEAAAQAEGSPTP